MTEATETLAGEAVKERPTERTSVMLTPVERSAVEFVQEVHQMGSIPDVLRQHSINDCVQIHRRALVAASRPAA